jgi:hypothetical protein
VDPGKLGNLPALTYVEAMLLAPLKVSRSMLFLRPEGRQDRPTEAYQGFWSGHVIALPQAAPDTLQKLFPMNMEDIPQVLNVVFLKPAKSPEDFQRMAERSPALKVSRRLGVVQWA